MDVVRPGRQGNIHQLICIDYLGVLHVDPSDDVVVSIAANRYGADLADRSFAIGEAMRQRHFRGNSEDVADEH